MPIKHRIKLLSLFIFAFTAWTNLCYGAFEILPGSWPTLPFTPALGETSTLINYIVYYFAFGMYIAGALAVISMAFAGVQLILSAENPENRNLAIGRMKGAALGLIILGGSFLLMGTINPKLQEVTVEPLSPLQGIKLVQGGTNQTADAPENSSNLDFIKTRYNAISWPQTLQDTEGNAIQNCDPTKHEVYIIYWYKDKGFKNFGQLSRLKCGDQFFFTWANSYMIKKEQPGVYVYDNLNCTPSIGSDTASLPRYKITSKPEFKLPTGWFSGGYKSVRIVNGPDPKTGPFFGAVAFCDPDYYTGDHIVDDPLDDKVNCFQHIKFKTDLPADDGYSVCYDLKVPTGDQWVNGSLIVYKWAGFKPDGTTVNVDTGVVLYTEKSWEGGNTLIDSSTIIQGNPLMVDGIFNFELNKIPPVYAPNLAIPNERKNQCATFDPAHKCLGSFKIEGNFLVIVSDVKDPLAALTNNWVWHVKAQAFPRSPRLSQSTTNPGGYSPDMGSSAIGSDLIKSENAKFMEIIPLAEKIQSEQ